eukprot:scaffold10781_cov42-Cyclotella_meneghiniana.AAC.2
MNNDDNNINNISQINDECFQIDGMESIGESEYDNNELDDYQLEYQLQRDAAANNQYNSPYAQAGYAQAGYAQAGTAQQQPPRRMPRHPHQVHRSQQQTRNMHSTQLTPQQWQGMNTTNQHHRCRGPANSRKQTAHALLEMAQLPNSVSPHSRRVQSQGQGTSNRLQPLPPSQIAVPQAHNNTYQAPPYTRGNQRRAGQANHEENYEGDDFCDTISNTISDVDGANVVKLLRQESKQKKNERFKMKMEERNKSDTHSFNMLVGVISFKNGESFFEVEEKELKADEPYFNLHVGKDDPVLVDFFTNTPINVNVQHSTQFPSFGNVKFGCSLPVIISNFAAELSKLTGESPMVTLRNHFKFVDTFNFAKLLRSQPHDSLCKQLQDSGITAIITRYSPCPEIVSFAAMAIAFGIRTYLPISALGLQTQKMPRDHPVRHFKLPQMILELPATCNSTQVVIESLNNSDKVRPGKRITELDHPLSRIVSTSDAYLCLTNVFTSNIIVKGHTGHCCSFVGVFRYESDSWVLSGDQPSASDVDNVSWGQFITIENFLESTLVEREVKTMWRMEFTQKGLSQYAKKIISTKSTDISTDTGDTTCRDFNDLTREIDDKKDQATTRLLERTLRQLKLHGPSNLQKN